MLLVLVLPKNGDAEQVHRAESQVELSGDAAAGRITNRTFEVVNANATQSPKILLRKEVRSRFNEGYEGGPGQIRIDAWRLPHSRGTKPLYSISDKGDEIGWLSYPDLLMVTIHGCCSSSSSYTIFNATTGKMLVYANGWGDSGNLAIVRKDGDVVLLIGVHDDHGGKQPPVFPKRQDSLPLLVTTADPSSCRYQLLFDFPVPRTIDTYITGVTWESHKGGRTEGLALELSEKDAIIAVMKVTVSDGRWLLLPVSGEGVDSSRVVPPTGVRMTKLAPCKL